MRLGRFFVVGMLTINLLFFAETLQGIKRGYPDFTVFYTAGKIVGAGHADELYNPKVQYEVQQTFAGNIPFRHGPLPYIHPPFEGVIFVPLTWLAYPQAFVAWDLLNLAVLYGVALILRRSVASLGAVPAWKFVFVSIAFFPVFACLLEGQDSILLLLLCTLAFYALKKNADLLAGCWLSLATFKFQFIVPVVLLFILWKRRRVAIGFAAVAIVMGLASTGLVGVKAMLAYPAYAVKISNTPGLGGVPAALLPNLRGLVTGWAALLAGAVGSALTGVASILIFILSVWSGLKFVGPRKIELQFSLAIVVAGLIAWQTNTHDLSLLVLPLVLIADYCLFAMPQPRRDRFVLLHPVWPLLISPLWMGLWLVWGKVNLMAVPLLWWVWKISRAEREAKSQRDSAAGLAVR